MASAVAFEGMNPSRLQMLQDAEKSRTIQEAKPRGGARGRGAQFARGRGQVNHRGRGGRNHLDDRNGNADQPIAMKTGNKKMRFTSDEPEGVATQTEPAIKSSKAEKAVKQATEPEAASSRGKRSPTEEDTPSSEERSSKRSKKEKKRDKGKSGGEEETAESIKDSKKRKKEGKRKRKDREEQSLDRGTKKTKDISESEGELLEAKYKGAKNGTEQATTNTTDDKDRHSRKRKSPENDVRIENIQPTEDSTSKSAKKDKKRKKKNHQSDPPIVDPTKPRLFNWVDAPEPTRGTKRKDREEQSDEDLKENKKQKIKNGTAPKANGASNQTSGGKKKSEEETSTNSTNDKKRPKDGAAWNANLLEGGDARKVKFMRLMGGKKAGVELTISGTESKDTAESLAKQQEELTRQSEAAIRKRENGRKNMGLGAA